MNKTEISGLIDKQIEFLRQLNPTEMQNALSATKARLLDDGSRVLIAGEYGRGKTTLLNALLGQEVLKTSALPVHTTNVVRHGERIDAFAGNPNDMVPVALEKLLEGEYQQVELYYPSDLCRGVKWIEYPSLSEQPESFTALIPEVDLVIVVLACDALFSAAESRWVKGIKDAGHTELFYVCNFLDRIPTTQIDQVKQAALARIPANADRIFFTAVLPALGGQENAIASLDQLRQALLGAITTISGRIKPARAMRLLEASLDAAQEQLDELQAQKSKREADLQARNRDLYLSYEAFAAASRNLDQDLQRLIEDTREVVQTMTGNLVRKLAQEFEEYIVSYEGADLHVAVDSKMKMEIEHWKVEELGPYLDRVTQQHEEILTRGVERVQVRLSRFYELNKAPVPPSELSVRDEGRFSSDIDVSVRGPGISPAISDFQLLRSPEVTLTVGGSLLAMFMLRPAPLGVAAGILGLAAAAVFAISKQKAATHTAHQDAAQIYGNALRSQVDEVSLAVWNHVHTEFERSQVRVSDWTEACKRETQESLEKELERATGDEGSNDTEDMRRRIDEIRKALPLL